MRTTRILLLCMLGAALLSLVASNSATGPDDCCFSVYPRRLKKTLISSYYSTDYRCPKIGIIFVTQKARHICVDPNLTWVQDIMKTLDEKNF